MALQPTVPQAPCHPLTHLAPSCHHDPSTHCFLQTSSSSRSRINPRTPTFLTASTSLTFTTSIPAQAQAALPTNKIPSRLPMDSLAPSSLPTSSPMSSSSSVPQSYSFRVLLSLSSPPYPPLCLPSPLPDLLFRLQTHLFDLDLLPYITLQHRTHCLSVNLRQPPSGPHHLPPNPLSIPQPTLDSTADPDPTPRIHLPTPFSMSHALQHTSVSRHSLVPHGTPPSSPLVPLWNAP
jgi:hypothetical protein